jgi:hypothetical protein
MARAVAAFAPTGVIFDESPAAVAPDSWTGGKNMRVQGAGSELTRGQVLVHPTPGYTHKFGMLTPVGEVAYQLYMGDQGVTISDGVTAIASFLPAGWTPFQAGNMTGAVLGGVAVFNRRGAPPWYWNQTPAAGSVLPVPGWLAGESAACIGAFGQHLFAGSLYAVSSGEERLAWSDAAPSGEIPGSWIPTATNQAGELSLNVGLGPIRAMRALGNSLMVYRGTSMYAIDYVGRPYIYSARLVSDGAGAASSNTVITVKGTHVLLTLGDIVQSDGTTVRSLGEGRIKEWLFSQMSQAGINLVHAYSVPQQAEVVFNLPLGSDIECNTALVWNHERDKWTIRDIPPCQHGFTALTPQGIPLTWANDTGTWDDETGYWNEGVPGGYSPRPVTVGEDVGIWRNGEGGIDWLGRPVIGSVERVGLRLSQNDEVVRIQRLEPAFEGSPGKVVRIQVGATLTSNESITWEPAQPFTIGSSAYIHCNGRGRYFGIRIEGEGPDIFTVTGFQVEFERGGRQ